jgi:hypothetical protein
MPTPLTINIPHNLGEDEARRRIAQGFANIEQQMTGGMLGMVSFQNRWEGNVLHLEGGALGQKITGRIHVLADSVQIQLDLPPLLTSIADKILGRVRQEAQRLLEKK